MHVYRRALTAWRDCQAKINALTSVHRGSKQTVKETTEILNALPGDQYLII